MSQPDTCVKTFIRVCPAAPGAAPPATTVADDKTAVTLDGRTYPCAAVLDAPTLDLRETYATVAKSLVSDACRGVSAAVVACGQQQEQSSKPLLCFGAEDAMEEVEYELPGDLTPDLTYKKLLGEVTEAEASEDTAAIAAAQTSLDERVSKMKLLIKDEAYREAFAGVLRMHQDQREAERKKAASPLATAAAAAAAPTTPAAAAAARTAENAPLSPACHGDGVMARAARELFDIIAWEEGRVAAPVNPFAPRCVDQTAPPPLTDESWLTGPSSPEGPEGPEGPAASKKYQVSVTCLELLSEKLRDVTTEQSAAEGRDLGVVRDPHKGIVVSGSVERVVQSYGELRAVVEAATARRAPLPAQFVVVVKVKRFVPLEGTDAVAEGRPSSGRAGSAARGKPSPTVRLSQATVVFAELAPYARLAVKGVELSRDVAEACKTANAALIAVGAVCQCLAENPAAAEREKAPWRGSKLTRLLQDSLGGRARTALLAMIASDADSRLESSKTLEVVAKAHAVAVAPRPAVAKVSDDELALALGAAQAGQSPLRRASGGPGLAAKGLATKAPPAKGPAAKAPAAKAPAAKALASKGSAAKAPAAKGPAAKGPAAKAPAAKGPAAKTAAPPPASLSSDSSELSPLGGSQRRRSSGGDVRVGSGVARHTVSSEGRTSGGLKATSK